MNPYILIKRPFKEDFFPHSTFQTSFRRNREIEATKWKQTFECDVTLPPLLPNVPPHCYPLPSTAGTSKRDTVPLITCYRLREAGYPVATKKVGLGTQQEKGQGPCAHKLTSSAMTTQLWSRRTGSVWDYVTFMSTARAEGERSTTWCPGIGLNFNRTKRGRGRGRRGRGSWKWNGEGEKGWNKRQAKDKKRKSEKERKHKKKRKE